MGWRGAVVLSKAGGVGRVRAGVASNPRGLPTGSDARAVQEILHYKENKPVIDHIGSAHNRRRARAVERSSAAPQ